jgi:hypothetical protein
VDGTRFLGFEQDSIIWKGLHQQGAHLNNLLIPRLSNLLGLLLLYRICLLLHHIYISTSSPSESRASRQRNSISSYITPTNPMARLTALLGLAAVVSQASAHFLLNYPATSKKFPNCLSSSFYGKMLTSRRWKIRRR